MMSFKDVTIKNEKRIEQWSTVNSVDSLLTDTSVKRTPRVGPCLSLLPLFDSL